MIVIQIVSLVLATAILIFAISRSIIQYRINQVRDIRSYPVNFQKKFKVFRQRKINKQVGILLVLCIGLSIGLILTTGSVYLMQQQVDKLSTQNKKITERMDQVKTQQDEMANQVPVKSYPKDGLALADYQWDQIFSDQENAPYNQATIETQVGELLSPYFGLAQAIISIDPPSQTLSITLTGNTEDLASKDVVIQNIDSFINDANSIPKLTQIHVQMTASVEGGNQTFYEASYMRESDSDKFKLQEKQDTPATPENDNLKGKG